MEFPGYVEVVRKIFVVWYSQVVIYSLVVISIFRVLFKTEKKYMYFISERFLNRIVDLYKVYFSSATGCMMENTRNTSFCCNPGPTECIVPYYQQLQLPHLLVLKMLFISVKIKWNRNMAARNYIKML